MNDEELARMLQAEFDREYEGLQKQRQQQQPPSQPIKKPPNTPNFELKDALNYDDDDDKVVVIPDDDEGSPTIDEDEALARSLQETFDREQQQLVNQKSQTSISSSSTSKNSSSTSLLDPEYELIDPVPDIHALFLDFNERFFGGVLSGIEVRWSKTMTLCAGKCYYFPGGYCSVRLSEPLLTLRPRSDLVNTLIHELIHAFLFVTKNNTDRDGHGPTFQHHMNRINKEAGTNITIYHTFHDEVNHHRKHVWKCNGPCVSQPPYFGIVKRAMNRPPQKADWWFAQHAATCGGTYTKIAGPDIDAAKNGQEPGKKKAGKRKQSAEDGVDGEKSKSKKAKKEDKDEKPSVTIKQMFDGIMKKQGQTEEGGSGSATQSDTTSGSTLTAKPKGLPPRHLRKPEDLE